MKTQEKMQQQAQAHTRATNTTSGNAETTSTQANTQSKRNNTQTKQAVALVGGRFGSCFGTNICSRYFNLENATLKFFKFFLKSA